MLNSIVDIPQNSSAFRWSLRSCAPAFTRRMKRCAPAFTRRMNRCASYQ